MSRIVLIVFVICGLCSCKDASKPPESKTVPSRHTALFNTLTDSTLNAYYGLTEAFVNWDSLQIIEAARNLENTVDHWYARQAAAIVGKPADYMAGIRKNIRGMEVAGDITAKRHLLNDLTLDMDGFLRAVQYDQQKLYLQECNMPYNDTGSGLWISKTATMRNPYLGLHHPHYGRGMIECGVNKSVIDYTSNGK